MTFDVYDLVAVVFVVLAVGWWWRSLRRRAKGIEDYRADYERRYGSDDSRR